ncbi:MAG: carboxymuconolactone decarboxylase family protein [Acidimicrobiales bacterium]
MSEPRIAPIDPTEAPDDLVEFLTSDTGSMNIFTTMANHPGLLRRYLPFGGKLLNGGSIDPRQRELLILRTGWNAGSDYEWGQHVRIGRLAGLTDIEIERIAAGPRAGGWSATDVTLLTACDELCADHMISDATWAALSDFLDTRQLVELTLLVGHYVMIAGMLNSLRVPRDAGVGGFLES